MSSIDLLASPQVKMQDAEVHLGDVMKRRVALCSPSGDTFMSDPVKIPPKMLFAEFKTQASMLMFEFLAVVRMRGQCYLFLFLSIPTAPDADSIAAVELNTALAI